jgi:hypothetical protein
MAENGRGTAWTNHYSAKYNRCFVKIEQDLPAPTRATVALQDAFERSILAIWMTTGYCKIGLDDADCKTVYDYINEHMKN